MTTTIRVDEQTREKARALSCEMGVPIQEVVARAVEAYRRQWLFDCADRAYEALRADPKAWAEVEEERRLWDNTLLDGLEEA
jgi:hypothetical protein